MLTNMLVHDDDGQDVIEYALLASLIAVVVMATVGDAASQVGRLWNFVSDTMTNALH